MYIYLAFEHARLCNLNLLPSFNESIKSLLGRQIESIAAIKKIEYITVDHNLFANISLHILVSANALEKCCLDKTYGLEAELQFINELIFLCGNVDAIASVFFKKVEEI